MRTLSAAIVTLAVLNSPAVKAETWIPTTNTAISVTGKVQFTPNKITFQNGQSLSIKAATPNGIDGQVFKVIKPADPVLIRGNKLCGRSTVKFLVLGLDESKDRSMAVYDGSVIPSQDTASCASYGYVVGR